MELYVESPQNHRTKPPSSCTFLDIHFFFFWMMKIDLFNKISISSIFPFDAILVNLSL